MKVTKIEIDTGEQKLSFSLDELRALKGVLDELFSGNQPVTIPSIFPIYPTQERWPLVTYRLLHNTDSVLC